MTADDVLALNGKTLRGICGDPVPGVHLITPQCPRAWAVLGQVDTAGKERELVAARTMLAAVTLVKPKVQHRPHESRTLWARADLVLNARAGGAGA